MRKYIVPKLTAEHITLSLSSLRFTSCSYVLRSSTESAIYRFLLPLGFDVEFSTGPNEEGNPLRPQQSYRAYLADLKPLGFQRCPRIHCMIIMSLRLVFYSLDR
jgi:hypothetical protein